MKISYGNTNINSDIHIYGSHKINHIKNKQIMEIVIQFILASETFEMRNKPDLFHTCITL